MNEEELGKKIRKHNEKVDYNRSTASWIADIIACLDILSDDYHGGLQAREIR